MQLSFYIAFRYNPNSYNPNRLSIFDLEINSLNIYFVNFDVLKHNRNPENLYFEMEKRKGYFFLRILGLHIEYWS
jgi:hypothetical protein